MEDKKLLSKFSLRAIELYKLFIEENISRISEILNFNFRSDFFDFLSLNKDFPYNERLEIIRNFTGLVKGADEFSQILKEIPNISRAKRITDVAAGELGTEPFAIGSLFPNCEITAVDPLLCFGQHQTQALGNVEFMAQSFLCDYVAGENCGFNIEKTDLVVADGPCQATENMARQCLKYKKPMFLIPCSCKHRNLLGTQFITAEKFLNYVAGLSPDLKVAEHKKTKYAILTNLALPEEDFNLASCVIIPSNKDKSLTAGFSL